MFEAVPYSNISHHEESVEPVMRSYACSLSSPEDLDIPSKQLLLDNAITPI